LHSRRKIMVFDEVKVSFLVEKSVGDKRVPIPVVIENAGQKTAVEISGEIKVAAESAVSESDAVIGRKSSRTEKLYFWLPGFMRRFIWKLIAKKPAYAYRIMGNVSITSLGMMGSINGWFMHRSVHPLSFGIGSVIRKPVVAGNEIEIREILNVTVLMDHDVVDGAPMTRFIKDLVRQAEIAAELEF
jgi:hypothetical protein